MDAQTKAKLNAYLEESARTLRSWEVLHLELTSLRDELIASEPGRVMDWRQLKLSGT